MLDYINYLSDKNDLASKIQAVKAHFEELSKAGIDVSNSILKLDKAIQLVQSDKLSIALVGAFSDGKTSVAAGWLNEKVDNMKISTDESSDEILCYEPKTLPEGCQIVDTPGLFGDKTSSDENGEEIVLSERTKKYLSEANLILYVVTAKNPIKDSHKECVRWILNDLNKLNSTIFVINRMDEVADLTDEDDFGRQERIKTDTLRQKLVDCGISKSQAEKAKVVCISAAPYGKGVEFWKDKRDEYLERSHLTLLENATHEILKHSRDELIAKTGCDILNDELNLTLQEISRQENAITDVILPEKEESLRRNQKDLEKLVKKIKQSRADIQADLKQLKKRKITVIRAATQDNFTDVIEDEIGIADEKTGFVLSEDISTIFNKYSDLYSGWALTLGEQFQAEYDKQNKTIEALLKMGAKGAADGVKRAGALGVDVLKQAIFQGRDILGKLGVVIKFKPWQAFKLAKFTATALPIIGSAIDIIADVAENLGASIRQRKLEKKKEELKEAINEAFSECLDNLKNDEWFFENFAPQVNELTKQIEYDKQEILQIKNQKNEYEAIAKKLNQSTLGII